MLRRCEVEEYDEVVAAIEEHVRKVREVRRRPSDPSYMAAMIYAPSGELAALHDWDGSYWVTRRPEATSATIAQEREDAADARTADILCFVEEAAAEQERWAEEFAAKGEKELSDSYRHCLREFRKLIAFLRRRTGAQV